jgi:hypothetical protein
MSTSRADEMANATTEVERLRAQIDQLENELASLHEWANGVVADAQKRVYWLDRLHLDLDPIMRHLPVDFLLAVYLTLRGGSRRARTRAGALRRFVRRQTP